MLNHTRKGCYLQTLLQQSVIHMIKALNWTSQELYSDFCQAPSMTKNDEVILGA